MPFDPNQDHSIDLNDAAEMTKKYRETIGKGESIAAAFGKTAMFDILNQEDCMGLRAYYALGEKDVLTLVIVAVDSSGNDLYDGKLAEYGGLCPPICSAENPLNS